MRTLTYTGRAGLRRLGRADGLNTDVEFRRGEPLAVSDTNAERILALVPDEFSAEAEQPADPPAPAPSMGDPNTSPEED